MHCVLRAAEQARRVPEHVDTAVCNGQRLPQRRLHERPGSASILPVLQTPETGCFAAPLPDGGGPRRHSHSILKCPLMFPCPLPRPLLSPQPRCRRASSATGTPRFLTSPRPTKRAACAPAPEQHADVERAQPALDMQRRRRRSSPTPLLSPLPPRSRARTAPPPPRKARPPAPAADTARTVADTVADHAGQRKPEAVSAPSPAALLFSHAVPTRQHAPQSSAPAPVQHVHPGWMYAQAVPPAWSLHAAQQQAQAQPQPALFWQPPPPPPIGAMEGAILHALATSSNAATGASVLEFLRGRIAYPQPLPSGNIYCSAPPPYYIMHPPPGR